MQLTGEGGGVGTGKGILIQFDWQLYNFLLGQQFKCFIPFQLTGC